MGQRMKPSTSGRMAPDGQGAGTVPVVEDEEQGAGRHATGAMLLSLLVLVLTIFLSPLLYDLSRWLERLAGR